MKAFSSTIKKTEFLKEIKKHREQDQLIQGTYGKQNGDWKGCAVACSLRSIDLIRGNELKEEYNQHERYETELGIPKILARLEDRIFEGLPKAEAQLWPERFTKAIKVGADLEMVVSKFFVWLLMDRKDGVYKHARPDGKKAIKRIAELYQRKIDSKRVTDKQFKDDAAAAYAVAYAAAYAAAAAAAYAAAAAADVAAAYAAADAAAYAAAAAADVAAADAAADARTTHYKKMADKLVEILNETK